MESRVEDLSMELARAFDVFEALQDGVVSAMESGSRAEVLAAVPRWTNERNAAFAALKGCLERLNLLLQERPELVSMGMVWRDRLNRLLEREDRIYQEMFRMRESIQEEMGRLAKGRSAMVGYGSHPQRPRFVSGSA